MWGSISCEVSRFVAAQDYWLEAIATDPMVHCREETEKGGLPPEEEGTMGEPEEGVATCLTNQASLCPKLESKSS